MTFYSIGDLPGCDAACLSDVNQDGKVDVVTTSATAVYWFQKLHTGKYYWNRHTIFEGGTEEMEGVIAADFDGDGEIEAASLDQTADLIRLHKHPTGNPAGSWTTVSLLAGRPNLQNCQAIDIDDDGLPELVFTFEGEMAGEGGVHWLDFDGVDATDPADWIEYVMIQKGGAWWLASSHARWTVGNTWEDNRPDLSGAGTRDIIFTCRNNRNPGSQAGIFWLQEPGDVTQLWTLNTIQIILGNPLHCDFGDFSGDGNGKDIVTFELDLGILPRIYRYSDNWSNSALAYPDDTVKCWNIRRGPSQTNGRDDIILITGDGVELGGVYRYQWSGSAYVPTSILEIDYIHPMDDTISFYDLDGDGVVEAIIPDSGGNRMTWLEGIG